MQGEMEIMKAAFDRALMKKNRLIELLLQVLS